MDKGATKIDRVFWFLISYIGIYLVALKMFPSIFGSLAIAFLFTVIIDVIAQLLEKIKIPRKIGIILASFLFFGTLAYSLYSVFPIIINESEKIFSSNIVLPKGKFWDIVQNIINYTNTNLQDIIVKFLSYIASNVSKILTMALLLIVASAYFNVIKKKIKGLIPKLFPNSSLKEVESYLRNSYTQIQRFSYGQLITAFLVGISTFILSVIFSIPNPMFLGLLAGITDFIPYLGVIITAIPMLLLGFSAHGFIGVVFALLILTITNQLEMWVYSPRIAQEQVKINWFVILIFMLSLGQFFGIVGVLITVPLLIIIKNLWITFVIPYLKSA
jgi:predicted PurR-regulated permease PerM